MEHPKAEIETEAGLRRPLVAYFGHDARETAVQRRIATLEWSGCEVVGFTFQRRHQAERAEVPFANVPLGTTVDRNYLKRLWPLALGLARTLAHARTLRRADVIQARNIDMLAIAAAARALTGSRARLVYEVLDVQRVFVGTGRASRLMRALERRLLRGVDLLLVSSPDFVTRYFAPVQGHAGPWHLLENKISGPQMRAGGEAYGRGAAPAAEGPPWVVGWFGVLRCRRSLDTLATIADALGPRVRVYIRGRLSREDISEADLAAVLEARPNMVFEGAYRSPEDLGAIYGQVHFSWSMDYTDAGSNSDWLLPNRLYEGGFFGTVALARAGTATGRLVTERGLGMTFDEPVAETVAAFLDSLTPDAYAALRQRIVDAPRDLFIDEADTRAFLDRLGCGADRTTPSPAIVERHA